MTGRMDRVKAVLREYPEVCALADLYGDALANGRNDISTLKRRGWIIDDRWCAHEEGPTHKHYWLRRDPEQLRLMGVA